MIVTTIKIGEYYFLKHEASGDILSYAPKQDSEIKARNWAIRNGMSFKCPHKKGYSICDYLCNNCYLRAEGSGFRNVPASQGALPDYEEAILKRQEEE